MRIPQVREALLSLASTLDAESAEKIRALVKEMYRRPYVRKAGPKRTRPSNEAVQSIATLNPTADYVELASYFSTNPGRISEALAGFRT